MRKTKSFFNYQFFIVKFKFFIIQGVMKTTVREPSKNKERYEIWLVWELGLKCDWGHSSGVRSLFIQLSQVWPAKTINMNYLEKKTPSCTTTTTKGCGIFYSFSISSIPLQLFEVSWITAVSSKTNRWLECGLSVCGCKWFLWEVTLSLSQSVTTTAFIPVEPWETWSNGCVVLNCMQDTHYSPPPLILSAMLNGEHHMVKQQASHDNKGRYLTGTLEPSYRSANFLRQIMTMDESVEQQKSDGLGTFKACQGRRVELRSGLGPLTLKHLMKHLHVTVFHWHWSL